MYLDYKYNLKVNDNGSTEVIIIVYSGEFKNVESINPITFQPEIIDQYCRNKIVGFIDVEFEEILSDNELLFSLNEEIKFFRDTEFPEYLIIEEQNLYA